jgi:hypothetical protein
MDEVIREQGTLTFNGPLEAGVRAVAILGAAFPRCFDVQRLTAFDYLLIHTGQIGGPEDLHPATPIQTPATDVRRKTVQDALHLMMTRDLVTRYIDGNGIRFCAGEAASMFLESLRSPYLLELKGRANWLVGHFADTTQSDFDALMRRFFNTWVVEFQDVERSLGVIP